MIDLSIVVPCYNEVDNVSKIVTELFPVVIRLVDRYAPEIVFVDDGSTDGTDRALLEMLGNEAPEGVSVKLERHDANRGLGAALRTGLAASQGRVIITTDSDGTYRFSEIPNLMACIRPGIDLVTASPYHPDGEVVGVPGYRLLLSRGSSAIYRLIVDGRVHTYTSLFRAYRREVIENVPFQADGFLAGTELLVRAMLQGYRVAEYPAVLHQRTFGVSKAKLARTIVAHVRFQAKVVLARLGLAQFAKPARGWKSPHGQVSGE